MNEVFAQCPVIDVRVFFDLDHPLRKGFPRTLSGLYL